MLFKRPLSISSLYLEGPRLLSISSRSPFFNASQWTETCLQKFVLILYLWILLHHDKYLSFTCPTLVQLTVYIHINSCLRLDLFFISCVLPYWRILSCRSRILSGSTHFQSPKVANTEKWSHESKAICG